MTHSRTIMVLGGGVGGVVAAVELRKRLGRSHRVVLVDRERNHVFWPSLLWLMVGMREVDRIVRPLSALEKRDVDVIHGDIEAIDPIARHVVVSGVTHEADFLVISLGADPAPERIPGLADSGHTFCTLDGATALRDKWNAFQGGKVVVLTAAPAYKCPAAPYEAAMLFEASARARGIGGRTRVELHAAEPGPMGVAGPEASAMVRALVESRNVAYFPGRQIASCDATARRLAFADGAAADFDLLVYVPPFQAPVVAREAGLVNEAGWIAVDRFTMETRFENVYAIGDVTTIPLAMGKPLPKAGVFAHGQAGIVAERIAASIRGASTEARFNGHGECFIETGDGKAGFGRGNFYAEPVPAMKMYAPGRHWHAGKVLFEKDWLRRWF